MIRLLVSARVSFFSETSRPDVGFTPTAIMIQSHGYKSLFFRMSLMVSKKTILTLLRTYTYNTHILYANVHSVPTSHRPNSVPLQKPTDYGRKGK
jgi:hypothetical protein